MIHISTGRIADILPAIKYESKIFVEIDWPLRYEIKGTTPDYLNGIYTKLSKEGTSMDGMPACCYQGGDGGVCRIWVKADGTWNFD